MIISITEQAKVFVLMFVCGAALGLLYDTFRIFRKAIPHSNFFTQLEDMIYWIIVSLASFYIILNKNYGEVRAFSIIATFIGMVFYFFTISKLIMGVSIAIINFFKKLLRAILVIIVTPFKFLYKLLSPIIEICGSWLRKRKNGAKKVLHKYKKYAKIKGQNLKRDLKIISKKV